MADNRDILNAAVSLLVKAALLAARFSGRVRRRSLKRLAAMDADAKAREILSLKDRVYQLEMAVKRTFRTSPEVESADSARRRFFDTRSMCEHLLLQPISFP